MPAVVLMASMAQSQVEMPSILDRLPPVEVPSGWVKAPAADSPFKVMVALTLTDYATNADSRLSQLLNQVALTQTYNSLYGAHKGEQAAASALVDATEMFQRDYQAQSQSLYGGGDTVWMSVDPDVYTALQQCIHQNANSPNGRQDCLNELKTDQAKFVSDYSPAWDKDVFLIDKYFDQGGPALVRGYARDMKYTSWGFERVDPPESATRISSLQTSVIELALGVDCDKSTIPTQITWTDTDLSSLAFQIEPEHYAKAYPKTTECAGYKKALATLAWHQEARLAAALLSSAASQIGVPPREKEALIEQLEDLRERIRIRLGDAEYFRKLDEQIAREESDFGRFVLASLVSHWGDRR
ncbi:MAG: hypothetical protein HYY13_11090 [Nitrospirae bacterium]|nr:hypothetical protein [Nitrospirota bacterium]